MELRYLLHDEMLISHTAVEYCDDKISLVTCSEGVNECKPVNACEYVQMMKVAKCPTDELSLTNCAVVSEQDFDTSRVRYYLLITYQFLS